MWRFAVDDLGLVRQDTAGRLGGRHAYCCRNRSCFEKFLGNKKGLSRAFRSQVRGFDEGLHDLFGSEE
jgi:predicted RNA-binding protein YlxR (DUF448 family)